MTEIDILLPFGLPPAELAADLAKALNAPALALLASRATADGQRRDDVEDFQRALPHERWLSRQFGLEDALKISGSPPVAAAWMRALDLPVEPGTWFVLQPVHFHIARDHLVLTDPRQLALSEADSRRLFDIAAPLFQEAGKRVLFGNAGTWFVDAEDWAELQTSSPDAASGHNIDIWMPSGPGERDWRKVQNDVQMHWFNHAVNEEREARQMKPVNSLWLWGGPARGVHPSARHYDKAFNLSEWMQAFEHGVPGPVQAPDAAGVLPALGRKNLLLLDALFAPALSDDWGRWIERLQQLEEHWFAPLLQALKAGKLDRISLIATHDSRISRFTATRSSLRKFWVKPTLATLCP